MPCPPNFNPGDFYVHTLAAIPGKDEESKKKIKEICDAFEVSDFGKEIIQAAKDNQSVVADESAAPVVQLKRSPYKASWGTQFKAVLGRSWTTVIREPRVLRMKGVQTIVRISEIVQILKFLNDFVYYLLFTVCCTFTRVNLQRSVIV